MRRDDDIFSDALELEPAERRSFLERACGDKSQRARIDALLTGHDYAGDFLPPPRGAKRTLPGEESPGRVIGRYTLREKIGEGGCGAVWVADQAEPVRRRVALKVIKLGMDTKEVVARFDAERQALALMDHPNIARVFDGGATDGGRPYFVMELVRGPSITRYCDQHRLSTAQRIDLFINVCDAVAHAHQRGVIHRDLKPSNILVATDDGRATPKVIDFGIAKATQGRLTSHTLYTGLQQLVGTPAYMSPEQTDSSTNDVGPRSDIYTLGVALYELLTGELPFGGIDRGPGSLDALREQICHVEPTRPSVRLRSLAPDAQQLVARNRSTTRTQLQRRLRGDLDWIVMRCLEKDPARRYATARALAEDLRRHLQGAAVLAHAPGKLHRLRAFARRHRRAALAAAALIGVLAIATVPEPRALRARRLAAEAGAMVDRHSSTTVLQLAKRRCEQAVALASEDAEIRALYSYVLVALDTIPARAHPQRDEARIQADIAMRLSPTSFGAQLAKANVLRLQAPTLNEAITLLRGLVAQRPRDRRAVESLMAALSWRGDREEALALADQLASLPGGQIIALQRKCMLLVDAGRFDEAVAVADKLLALAPCAEHASLKVKIGLHRGDPRAGVAALENVPSAALLDLTMGYRAVLARLWNHEPQRALEIIQAWPQPYIECGEFTGPKAYLLGLAHAAAGKPLIAAADWQAALDQTNRHFASEPNSVQLIGWRAVLHARLGNPEQARQEIDTYWEVSSSARKGWFAWDLDRRVLAAGLRLGHDQARLLKRMSFLSRSYYRCDPEFDGLRDQPWFQEALSEAEAAADRPTAK